jgi:hypothetical protein
MFKSSKTAESIFAPDRISRDCFNGFATAPHTIMRVAVKFQDLFSPAHTSIKMGRIIGLRLVRR